jgi:hypothetical protein
MGKALTSLRIELAIVQRKAEDIRTIYSGGGECQGGAVGNGK